jgi:hypothetical protein
MVMKYTPVIEKVITEGAELYCERQGSGPLHTITAWR